MTAISELRARRALKGAGLDAQMPLELASSVTNEVWLGPDVVVRINTQPDRRLQREAELAMALPSSVGYPTILADGEDLGIEWLISERALGRPLSRCWPAMHPVQRRRAVRELAERMQAIHRTTAPALGPLHRTPQLLDRSPSGSLATRRLLAALQEAARLPNVDPVVLHEAAALVSATAGSLDPFDGRTLVHGDLTFENVLWDGQHITAVLDFEWSRPGPSDLDLDVLLRFVAYPELHVAADYEHLTRREDYLPVAWWLAEEYPELFQRPRALDRLRIYSIAWDVQELQLFPPRRPAADLHRDHPLNRLQRTVRRVGHLDLLDGSGEVPSPDARDESGRGPGGVEVEPAPSIRRTRPAAAGPVA